MLNIQRTASGAAIHLIRYAFDEERDRTPPLPELTVDVRLPERLGRLSLHTPGGEARGGLDAVSEDGWHRLRLRDVPLYAIAHLEPA